jgi:hypothetical protein
MPDYIGLYYPHIAFPGDAWIKLATLYWDRLGRIVPPNHQHQDSDTVQRLRGELGFIEDVVPVRSDTLEVGDLFVRLLHQYGEQLLRRYRVLSQDTDLAYVYSDAKMAYSLAKALLDAGLAVRRRGDRRGEEAQVGMHPQLAFVYMEAFAEQMALRRGLRLVTDNVRDHVAVSGYSLERLTQALLETDDPQSRFIAAFPTQDEVVRQMVTIALQTVLPRDMEGVPVAKIIHLRQRHRSELTAFQTYMHEFVTKLDTIQGIDDPTALKVHLEVAYEREIKPQLDDLTKCMRSLAIETVTGVLNVKAALPPLLASTGAALHLPFAPPEVTVPTAVAWSTFPVFQKKRAEMREKVQTSPAAYLLYVREGLMPTNVVSQVVRVARQMFFGV